MKLRLWLTAVMVLTTLVAALLLFLNGVFELIDAIRLWPKGCGGFSCVYHSNHNFQVIFFCFALTWQHLVIALDKLCKAFNSKRQMMKSNLELATYISQQCLPSIYKRRFIHFFHIVIMHNFNILFMAFYSPLRAASCVTKLNPTWTCHRLLV